MANASISGLASGLDTATIVSQLMQIEAMPQARLKTQVRTQETALTRLQDLNTKLAALTTRAQDLAKPTGWTPLTATSSSDKVAVTTTVGAAATALSFTVQSTASAHQVMFTAPSALTDVVAAEGLTFDDGSGPVTVDTGDGTLSSVVRALNDSEHGLRASAVRVADGSYQLRVESTRTGDASRFALTGGVLGTAEVLAEGGDAVLAMGSTQIRSATNTFADLVPGVTVTLGAGAASPDPVTVTLASDSQKMTDTVKGLVDAVNSILGEIDTLTRAGGNGAPKGVLAGDSNLRSLRDQLLGSVYSAEGGGLADVGVQLDRYGKLTFDTTAFKAAYEGDPAAVAARFTDAGDAAGFAGRVSAAADRASDSVDGTVTESIKGRRTSLERLNDSIEAWDLRLELRRTALTRQFTALETALGRMNSQSSWLAGQIASLPTASS